MPAEPGRIADFWAYRHATTRFKPWLPHCVCDACREMCASRYARLVGGPSPGPKRLGGAYWAVRSPPFVGCGSGEGSVPGGEWRRTLP